MIDFFAESYRTEGPRSRLSFGIRDGTDDSPAYTTIDTEIPWAATVLNKGCRAIQFVPIDKNIPLTNMDGKDAKRCDGMLLIRDKPDDMLAFIELKTGKTRNRKQWIGDAVEQLESTIVYFNASHSERSIKKRRAYVCNGIHPVARVFSMERVQRFYDKTGFMLDVNDMVQIEEA